MEPSDTEYHETAKEDEYEPPYVKVPLSFLSQITEGLQIGLENTEEIFIENGARTTRSERQKALRLEDDMRTIGTLLAQIKGY